MSGWGCVHEINGLCSRVADRPCDPGMKGCVLAGRFRFSNEEKNRPPRRPRPQTPEDGAADGAAAEGAEGAVPPRSAGTDG